MPEFREHAPGTFCWAELITTDSGDAKRFYSALMGWDHHEDEVGPNQIYTMWQKAGKNIGAMYQRTPEQAQMKVPSHWASFLTVADVDATVALARDNGGRILREPVDVMDSGRLAAFQDPTGAIISIWQPRRHFGAELKAEPGSICWQELATRDTETAAAFYAAVFGWQPRTDDMGGTPYTSFMLGEEAAGGMMAIQPEWGEVPPHWLVYFAVEDCDRTVAQARDLGASVLVEATTIPEVGRFAMIQDPQGAVFGVIKLS
jgi:predicted enzyme related to lactoylglutathione lyase